MIRTTLLAIVLFTSMVSISQAAVVSNLLTDPQFNSDFSPWSKGEVGMVVQYFSAASQDFGAHHDDGSGTDGFAKIEDISTSQPNFGLIYSEYKLASPGEIWEGQAWARSEGGNSLEAGDEVAMKVSFYDAGFGFLQEETSYVTPTDAWTQFAPLTAVAPAGTNYVRLQLAYASDPGDTNSTGYVLFDTASLGIQAVPEPSTLALALLGLGLVAATRAGAKRRR